MKVAVACGGTGGHIFPGLATAQILKEKGHDVTLWLAGKDVENTAVQGWSGPIVTVRAEGFSSLFSFRVFVTLWKLFKAMRVCKTSMAQQRPDVVLAMGSYASVGPVLAAMRLKIPFIFHESNVLPGRAVKLLSRWSAGVAACFEETRFYLRGRNVVVTGMPMRKEIEREATQFRNRKRPDRPFTVLVMGGSRGAKALNEIVSQSVVQAYREGFKLRVIHLTGKADEEKVKAFYEKAGVNHRTQAFAHDMAAIYAETDLAICRSGAATCAELLAFAIPALLVPYPHAIHDHQMINARAMEKMETADVIPEKDLSVTWLNQYLMNGVKTSDRLEKMKAAALAKPIRHGAEALAEFITR